MANALANLHSQITLLLLSFTKKMSLSGLQAVDRKTKPNLNSYDKFRIEQWQWCHKKKNETGRSKEEKKCLNIDSIYCCHFSLHPFNSSFEQLDEWKKDWMRMAVYLVRCSANICCPEEMNMSAMVTCRSMWNESRKMVNKSIVLHWCTNIESAEWTLRRHSNWYEFTVGIGCMCVWWGW